MTYGSDTEELLQRIAKATTSLDISRLNVTSLPALPVSIQVLYCNNTPLTSLPALPASLQRLYCDDTQLTSLPELPASLQVLWCSNTHLTSLPELPAGLQWLYCQHTQVTSLPELPASLRVLCCNNTPLTSLPDLPASLQVLYCNNTQLVLQRNSQESIPDYNLRLRIWREEQASKKRIQEKHGLLKEEIVMAAWHPHKVERWLEAGVELEDM